jgi:hypothetical protein
LRKRVHWSPFVRVSMLQMFQLLFISTGWLQAWRCTRVLCLKQLV